MSQLQNTLTKLAAHLSTHLAAVNPNRVVTRKVRDMSAIPDDELKRGVFSLMAHHESDYADFVGGPHLYGTLKVMVIAQVQAENPDGTPGDGEATENAIGEMVDEIKSWTTDETPGVNQVLLKRWDSNSQLDAPFGWATFELEVIQ